MSEVFPVPSKLDCPICTPRQFMEAVKNHYVCPRCDAILILTEKHQ